MFLHCPGWPYNMSAPMNQTGKFVKSRVLTHLTVCLLASAGVHGYHSVGLFFVTSTIRICLDQASSQNSNSLPLYKQKTTLSLCSTFSTVPISFVSVIRPLWSMSNLTNSLTIVHSTACHPFPIWYCRTRNKPIQ